MEFSAFVQILMQCTHRLGLTTSARRLYAEDGTQFLDTDDIVSWAIENYRNTYADMMDSLWLEKGDQQQIGFYFVILKFRIF